jgi:hypothetical protein
MNLSASYCHSVTFDQNIQGDWETPIGMIVSVTEHIKRATESLKSTIRDPQTGRDNETKRTSFAHGVYLRIRDKYEWISIVGIERAWKQVYNGECWLDWSLSDSAVVEHSLSFVRVILTSILVNIFIVCLVGNAAKSKRTVDMMWWRMNARVARRRSSCSWRRRNCVCAENKANFLSPAQQLEPRLVLPLPTWFPNILHHPRSVFSDGWSYNAIRWLTVMLDPHHLSTNFECRPLPTTRYSDSHFQVLADRSNPKRGSM